MFGCESVFGCEGVFECEHMCFAVCLNVGMYVIRCEHVRECV